jgi:3-hydroxyisobutyrate dehydrogenase-like beta-hydroxyacid dehydrogenase
MPNVPLPTVAVLGLGALGGAIVKRLRSLDFPVCVWNRSSARAERLRGLGVVVAPTAKEAVLDAKIVVTCVADAEALRAIVTGPDGCLKGLGGVQRQVVCDMSTVGRACAREIAAAVKARGAKYLDCPVSGTVGPALRGELVALVGGAEPAIRRAEPVLQALAKKVIHCGAVGQGQAMKIVLNGLGAHHLVAFTSMLVLGERAGLSREHVVEAFTSGAFSTPSYQGKRAKVLARDYSPDFALSLALKDSALAVELQYELGMKLPVHRAIVRDLEDAVRAGLGDEDLFGLERLYAGRPKPPAD